MLGKKKTASVDIFSEVENVELEHELAFSATFFFIEPRREGKWNKDMHQAWKRQVFEAASKETETYSDQPGTCCRLMAR